MKAWQVRTMQLQRQIDEQSGRITRVEYDFKSLQARFKKLEQAICGHSFKHYDKGCLDSIFCSKCGALHSDWEVISRPGHFPTTDRKAAFWVDGRGYTRKEDPDANDQAGSD